MNIFRHLLNSSSLLLAGIIMLYGSQAAFFTLGNKGRYLALAVGFGCVLMAAFRRSGLRGAAHNFQFIFVSSLYFLFLLVLSFVREHDIFYAQKLVFIGVCFALFIAGYLLAKAPTRDGKWSDSIAMMFAGAFLTLILYRFLGYVKMISFAGTERGFDVSELNPVGVAYVNTILVLVYVYMAATTPRIISKPLYAIVAGMAVLVVITTGSRGAPLWGVASLCIIAVIMWRNQLVKFNTKTVLSVASAVVFGIPVALYLFKSNYALSEKLDIMITRFERLFNVFFHGEQEVSANARLEFFDYYFSNFGSWAFLGEKYYSIYPHNQFLEIGVRFGILGLPLLGFSLYIVGKSLIKGFSKKYEMSAEWYLIMLLFLFSYLQSMSSLSLEVNRTLWLGFGYLYGYQYRLKGFAMQDRRGGGMS
jgi:MFS family permease